MNPTHLTSHKVSAVTLTGADLAVTNPTGAALCSCGLPTGAATGTRVRSVQAEGGCVR
jgi:hypothetical protein